jgi:hypothetical protein
MDAVVILWHVRPAGDDDDEDEKLIGVYRTEDDARAAVERLAINPASGIGLTVSCGTSTI